jgi:hypothetical protein
LLAIAVVTVVIVVDMIIVIADPTCGTIAITNAIVIAAPGWRIIGSTMAMALLFHGGGISHGQAAGWILWRWQGCCCFQLSWLLPAVHARADMMHNNPQCVSVTNKFS